MTDEEIPLARPVIGEREQQLVLEVLRSRHLSLGPRLEEFERAFAARVGAPFASATSSGTSALHLALRAVGVGDGDEVVTTPFSFVASANVAIYERARPVFADIDPVTLNLDPDATAAAVSDRTAAIVPVHVFGYPADMVALERLGLPIVEDACEALGAVYADGGTVGGRGHPTTFGFYGNKQLTTGEGGMLTLADPQLKERVDSERNQGRAPDMGWLDHDRLGFNYRLSDIACALGLAQLERLDGLLSDARGSPGSTARRWPRSTGSSCPAATWRAHGVAGSCSSSSSRGASTATRRSGALGALGIPSKPYFPAIHLMSFYRERFGYREGEFPVCEDVAARSIALPFFPEMTEGQVDRVAQALASVLAGAEVRR